MQIKQLAFQTLAASALAFSATASNAAFTVYTSQAAFLAAVSAPGVDTFTGFNVTAPTSSPITRNAGPYSYTATTSDLSPDGAFGFFGAGTPANPFLSPNYALDSMTFNGFAASVRGIGGNFFGSDVFGAYAAGSVTVTVTDASGSNTQTVTATSPTAGSFLGFVSTGPITSLVLSAVQPATGALWPTVDNLTLAVPEPGTYALMLAGLGVVGLLARRRRA